MIKLVSYNRYIIVWLLLSDGFFAFSNSRSKNARLGFKQSLSHSQYVLFVFNILSHNCGSSPSLKSGIRAGNWFYGLEFFTRSMPCITELYSIFYQNSASEYLWTFNSCISSTLNHGDGSVSRHGLILCTDSYSIEDTIRLINVLIIPVSLLEYSIILVCPDICTGFHHPN